VLFALLFGFGALHRRFMTPQLNRDTVGSKLAILRVLSLEFTVGACLPVRVLPSLHAQVLGPLVSRHRPLVDQAASSCQPLIFR